MAKRKPSTIFISENFNTLVALGNYSHMKPFGADILKSSKVFDYEAVAAYNGLIVASIIWNFNTLEAITGFVKEFCLSKEGRAHQARELKTVSSSMQMPWHVAETLMLHSYEQCFELLRIRYFNEWLFASSNTRYSKLIQQGKGQQALLESYQDKTPLGGDTHQKQPHKVGLINDALTALKSEGLCSNVQPVTKSTTLKSLVKSYVKTTSSLSGLKTEDAILSMHQMQGVPLLSGFYAFCDLGIQERLENLLSSNHAQEVVLFTGSRHAHALFPDVVPLSFTSSQDSSTTHHIKKGGVQYHIFSNVHTDRDGLKDLTSFFKKYTKPTKKFTLEYYEKFLGEPGLEHRITKTAEDICDSIKLHNLKFDTEVDMRQCKEQVEKDLKHQGALTTEICSGKFNNHFFTEPLSTDAQNGLCGKAPIASEEL